MGFESAVPLTDHVVDKSEVETSQVVSCDSTVVEEMKISLSEEPFLQVPLENKEDTKSFGICDLENHKGNVAEAITPRGDIPELSICSMVSDDILSLGCETPRESIFDPFAPGPEEAACAPKKKMIRGAEVLSRRQLNFDSGDFPVKSFSFDWNGSDEEEQYLQVIHKMIVDLFISDGPLDQEEKN
uniref:Uncharacterized protein n=1 Tax=Arundo donax TaxID=35708 RepID=A0A0A9FGM9_ARUDO